jgi:hypothetical protein
LIGFGASYNGKKGQLLSGFKFINRTFVFRSHTFRVFVAAAENHIAQWLLRYTILAQA